MADVVTMTSEQAALHPDRIRCAIKRLSDTTILDFDANAENALAVESALVALEFVRKGQLAMGLTSNVVDAGSALVRLLGALK